MKRNNTDFVMGLMCGSFIMAGVSAIPVETPIWMSLTSVIGLAAVASVVSWLVCDWWVR